MKRERFFLGFLAVAVVITAWQITSVTGVVNKEFASCPTQILSSLITYFHTGSGWSDLWVSAQEFLIGFALSLGIGIPLGILMGWYKTLDELLNPLVIFLNSMPRIALAPLFVLWIGIASKVVIVITVATIPLIISARAGVVTTERSFVQMARSYGTSNFGLLWKIVLPGSVPAIVAGTRIAIGQGLMGMVLGEFIAAELGFEESPDHLPVAIAVRAGESLSGRERGTTIALSARTRSAICSSGFSARPRACPTAPFASSRCRSARWPGPCDAPGLRPPRYLIPSPARSRRREPGSSSTGEHSVVRCRPRAA